MLPGDKVVFKQSTTNYFTKGKIYEVCECPEKWECESDRIYIKANDLGNVDGWLSKFFKKVDLEIFNELGN